MPDLIAAHADWSIDPRKRWLSLARRQGRTWRAEVPRPVGAVAALLPGLLAEGAPVALGLDLPLGLPRAYAAGCEEADFPAFLAGLAARPEFFAVNAGLETVCAASPFYPARGVRGMTRAAHAAALGFAGPEGLSRWCDRATAERPAGAPLFWTLGANQSGKAAIAAWRDWLVPALATQGPGGAPVRLWPFQGGLHALLAPGVAVLAEVYPAEALRHCGLKLAGSKRAQGPRLALAPALREAMAARRVVPNAGLEATIAAGFGTDAAGEDRFDSLIGLLGLIGVLDGTRPDFVPEDPWIRRWEGWVLGQTALPRLSPPVAGLAAAGS
ncbi:hypothetical protein JYK14_19315 [Siccirubricoccus sp. KC 17139]|uniref:DUF429 domain-containing protein n=1 Tax=Siccirubricoccus soli TaxID=2899147 RepID=A0ABT1D8M9_9PROT|nr:hypothetical protein [Siccirubricoccus soli]MCO6418297.1 hypothetical protein [Siccirubricoccus soli]MCP2684432.1 hypothetical protein [Siccirubricoccus soli]